MTGAVFPLVILLLFATLIYFFFHQFGPRITLRLPPPVITDKPNSIRQITFPEHHGETQYFHTPLASPGTEITINTQHLTVSTEPPDDGQHRIEVCLDVYLHRPDIPVYTHVVQFLIPRKVPGQRVIRLKIEKLIGAHATHCKNGRFIVQESYYCEVI